ncbi:MAG: NAD(+)/NADH kinase, partial [Thermodesulfobacteriota bacterium]
MRFGIVGKKENKEVFRITKELCLWLEDKKVDFFVEKKLAENIGIKQFADKKNIAGLIDILIVLGGDGTFLGASRLVHGHDVAILGVNLGGLGFLTEFTVDELYLILEKILNGDYKTEKRELLRSKLVRDNKVVGVYSVLNDLVINNGPVSRVVD